jgi:RNA polymerase sigma factor (sigma-70 family)
VAPATEVTTATTEQALSPQAGRLEPEAAGAYLAELFARQGRMVLGLCRLLLRDPVEAEDAAQQVFLSAHQALLRGSAPRDPAAWTAAIARNECRARIRARMREPLALPELPSDLPDPLASAIRAADLHAVWVALGTLPRRQRRALVLRELGGLSYHELGRALGVSHSAVESLLFRARQRIRSLVAGTNAAAVPLALRDELARLIPGFDPGTTSAVARVAALPIAWKVASAAVGVGVVATGAGELHTRPPDSPLRGQAAPASVRPDPLKPTVARAGGRQPLLTQPMSFDDGPGRTEREAHGHESEPEHGDPLKSQEREQATQTSSEGPGPAPAEVAQVEESHEGPGEAETAEDSSGSEASGSDHSGGDGGSGSDDSGHSGPS